MFLCLRGVQAPPQQRGLFCSRGGQYAVWDCPIPAESRHAAGRQVSALFSGRDYMPEAEPWPDGTHRFFPASDSLYKIEFSDDGSAGTLAHLDFRYSASGPRGRQVIRNRGEAKIELMLQILATMLRHYCESGGLVPRHHIARLVATSNALTIADRHRAMRPAPSSARRRSPDRCQAA